MLFIGLGNDYQSQAALSLKWIKGFLGLWDRVLPCLGTVVVESPCLWGAWYLYLCSPATCVSSDCREESQIWKGRWALLGLGSCCGGINLAISPWCMVCLGRRDEWERRVLSLAAYYQQDSWLVPLLVLLGLPGVVRATLICSAVGMSLPGMPFVARSSIKKHWAYVTFFCWLWGYTPSCCVVLLVLESLTNSASSSNFQGSPLVVCWVISRVYSCTYCIGAWRDQCSLSCHDGKFCYTYIQTQALKAKVGETWHIYYPVLYYVHNCSTVL